MTPGSGRRLFPYLPQESHLAHFLSFGQSAEALTSPPHPAQRAVQRSHEAHFPSAEQTEAAFPPHPAHFIIGVEPPRESEHAAPKERASAIPAAKSLLIRNPPFEIL